MDFLLFGGASLAYVRRLPIEYVIYKTYKKGGTIDLG